LIHRDQETTATYQFVVRSLFGLLNLCKPFFAEDKYKTLDADQSGSVELKEFQTLSLASISDDKCRATGMATVLLFQGLAESLAER